MRRGKMLVVRLGKVRRGVVGFGVAWRGEARLGKVGYGVVLLSEGRIAK